MTAPRHKYVAARPVPQNPPARLGPRRLAYHRPLRSPITAFIKRLGFFAASILALGLIVVLGYKLWVDAQAESLIYSQSDPDTPKRHVALVFGAGLNSAGGPSAILYDRVATAADLYSNGRVDKLLMTGDNSTITHNEVEAMRKAAVDLGVADQDIVLDYAGFNTWDSCYRAREVFGLSEATLVTQGFHLPRALHTCNQLGVKSIGVEADRHPYPTFGNELREYVALAGTAYRILTGDKPRFLGPKVNVDEPQSR